MTRTSRSPWLVTHRSDPSADRRLVMFPHAGGGASYFRPWARDLAGSVELQAIQYPGRESRLSEPLLDSMADLASAAAEALSTADDRETIFFGHSMGAAVAYETVRLLAAAGTASHVTRLCVSGRELAARPPAAGPGPRTDEELIRSMVELGGTRPVVLDDPDLRRMVLDVVRNDYFLIDTYQWDPTARPLDVAVTALTGDRDPSVDPARLVEWERVTAGAFSSHVLPGGHFYLSNQVASVRSIVTA